LLFSGGQDVDLVMRSAVANFDIPRATEADRFYIRMYDGSSTPPNYSEFSVGLFVNLPLSGVTRELSELSTPANGPGIALGGIGDADDE
jgi:hypothetical protein